MSCEQQLRDLRIAQLSRLLRLRNTCCNSAGLQVCSASIEQSQGLIRQATHMQTVLEEDEEAVSLLEEQAAGDHSSVTTLGWKTTLSNCSG